MYIGGKLLIYAQPFLQVSSVTQTTVTEKEVLSQLLQEKDQLQREQEDRIKNLTQLLVTSSNQFNFQKVGMLQNTAVGRLYDHEEDTFQISCEHI